MDHSPPTLTIPAGGTFPESLEATDSAIERIATPSPRRSPSSFEATRGRAREFILLWTSQFSGNVASTSFGVIVGFILIDLLPGKSRQETEFLLGSTFALDMVPMILFGFLVGILLDRYSKARIYAWAELVRAGLVASIPLMHLVGLMSWWLLAVYLFALNTARLIPLAAGDTILPYVTRSANLMRMNGLFQTSGQVAMVAGAALSMVFAMYSDPTGENGITGMSVLLMAIAGLHVLSAGLVSILRLPPTGAPPAECDSGFEHLRASLKAIRHHRGLQRVLFLSASSNLFLVGPLVVGGLSITRESLPNSLTGYAIYTLVMGCGWLVGSMTLAGVGRRMRSDVLMAAGTITSGVLLLPFAQSPSFHTLLVIVFISGMTVPLITVARSTYIQKTYSKKGQLGSMISASNVLTHLATAGSMIGAGSILGLWSSATLFYVAAGALMAAGLVGLVLSVMNVRNELTGDPTSSGE